jgi:hypothetical protein
MVSLYSETGGGSKDVGDIVSKGSSGDGGEL